MRRALNQFTMPGQTTMLVWLTLAMMLAGHVLVAQEKFDVLRSASQIYSNVTVMSKTRQDVFITHASGLANVKVKDLDPETLQQMGYEAEKPHATDARPIFPQVLELDPKVREVEEQMVKEIQSTVQAIAPRLLAGILAALVLCYFIFCYCCMLICKKTGHEPGILVWIPILQAFPLLKAAGMSGWWFLLFFLPVINLFASIAWCVKIVQARQKSVWVAILLLLPVTNVLAFLYLAFSDGKEEEESFGQSPEKLAYER